MGLSLSLPPAPELPDPLPSSRSLAGWLLLASGQREQRPVGLRGCTRLFWQKARIPCAVGSHSTPPCRGCDTVLLQYILPRSWGAAYSCVLRNLSVPVEKRWSCFPTPRTRFHRGVLRDSASLDPYWTGAQQNNPWENPPAMDRHLLGAGVGPLALQ